MDNKKKEKGGNEGEHKHDISGNDDKKSDRNPENGKRQETDAKKGDTKETSKSDISDRSKKKNEKEEKKKSPKKEHKQDGVKGEKKKEPTKIKADEKGARKEEKNLDGNTGKTPLALEHSNKFKGKRTPKPSPSKTKGKYRPKEEVDIGQDVSDVIITFGKGDNQGFFIAHAVEDSKGFPKGAARGKGIVNGNGRDVSNESRGDSEKGKGANKSPKKKKRVVEHPKEELKISGGEFIRPPFILKEEFLMSNIS